MSVLGYCMGAPLSACFVATQPEFPLKNYVDMAGPIDFAHVGLFGKWLDPQVFDVDKYVDTLGSIPAEMVKMGFKLLKPTMDLNTNLNLWWNLWNPEYVAGFNALNKWANEYLPFPGEFFRHWVKDFYQQNQLIKGELTMAGRRVDLREIRCPVLAVGAKEDNIAPPALREAAHRRREHARQGVRGAAGRAHLADRRTRRLGALLAEGGVLAGRAVVAAGREGPSWPTTRSQQLLRHVEAPGRGGHAGLARMMGQGPGGQAPRWIRRPSGGRSWTRAWRPGRR